MEKKTKVVDIVKAFGRNVESATSKLAKKYEGFKMLHPSYANTSIEELDFDCDSYNKDGEEWWWAKLTTTVEVEAKAETNKVEVKPAKKSRKKVA